MQSSGGGASGPSPPPFQLDGAKKPIMSVHGVLPLAFSPPQKVKPARVEDEDITGWDNDG
eukprot:CAMPEP_0113883216 /NCGR_PEP_ID=MMETSP0780_2-20120614/9446_1 /TAXON_ID=652834 /ORGANISM="Palpitomonas bilix" /LENGTH=59 /DNA_ID=CAMNT_0000870435 /DNA_START=264 /DNA_END=439 /DNA_ORIENTATION=+ /assembly_acc=CAM_ASM_000599